MKTCYKCGVEKDIEQFCIDRRRPDGRQSRCRACRAAHYQADVDGVRVQSAAWAQANRAHVRARNLKYYYDHQDERSAKMAEWYQKNTDRVADTCREYREQNPHLIAAKQAKRRASERQAIPSWANDSAMKEWYLLARLLTEEGGIEWHVDHIVPLQGKTVCGLHWEGNMQVLPGDENISKGNKFWPDMPA